jgi:hypothetical protein
MVWLDAIHSTAAASRPTGRDGTEQHFLAEWLLQEINRARRKRARIRRYEQK